MGPLLALLLEGLIWIGLIGLGAFIIKALVIPALILVGMIAGAFALFYLPAKGLIPRKYRFWSVIAGVFVIVITGMMYGVIHFQPFSIKIPTYSVSGESTTTTLQLTSSTPLFSIAGEQYRDPTFMEMLASGLSIVASLLVISSTTRRRWR